MDWYKVFMWIASICMFTALVMIDGYLDESAYTVRIGKKRRYSDEQRAKMAERLKIAREKK